MAFTVTSGVYARINGELLLIANTDTVVPGGTATLGNFGGGAGSSPTIDAENIAFTARSSETGQAVFAYIDDELQILVSENTYVPGLGTLKFSHFGLFAGNGPDIDGRDIVFMGVPAPGIYVGTIVKIPTVSAWGLVVLTLLLLTAGSLSIREHHPLFASAV